MELKKELSVCECLLYVKIRVYMPFQIGRQFKLVAMDMEIERLSRFRISVIPFQTGS